MKWSEVKGLALLVACSGSPIGSTELLESSSGLYVYQYRINDLGVETSGLYASEYAEVYGGIYAWTRGTSSIEVQVHEPRAVQHIVLNVVARGRVDHVEFQGADGRWTQIPLDRWKEKQDVVLPPSVRPDDEGKLHVDFRSRTWLPGGDPRELGVAIHGVTVYTSARIDWSRKPPYLAKLLKVVILAGPDSRPPHGNHAPGEHEHFKTARLFARMLRSADGIGKLLARLHIVDSAKSWAEALPDIETADTVVILTEGNERSLLSKLDKIEVIQRQVERGCGLVIVHRASEVRAVIGRSSLMPWLGGYTRAGSDDAHYACSVNQLDWSSQPNHPVVRGLEPFTLYDEPVTNLDLRANDARFIPILPLRALSGTDLLAWAWERGDGGRGFSFLGGHLSANWKIPGMRKALLNGIVWTTGREVPSRGVDSEMPAARVDAEK